MTFRRMPLSQLTSFLFLQLVIYSYEEDFSRPELEVVHHHVNGLDGKVSRVEITVF